MSTGHVAWERPWQLTLKLFSAGTQPQLPSKDIPVCQTQRCGALADWCGGLLTGAGMDGCVCPIQALKTRPAFCRNDS
ncbi:hypothetical protein AALO_G00077090 [Alosa alosa]|uniref:Uncharacterized protein n=1 Tax=Alosa alosa TaxID=278164 RepID=A0AAV6GWS2_9TELE|nr:hypothetical protein AALO_G00077090 [Alosa alosa]